MLDIRTIMHKAIMSYTWCFYDYQTDCSWLFLVLKPEVVSSNDFFHCESTVKNWAKASGNNGVKEDKFTLKDLLFFLHVPRTGGRTYFHWYVILIAYGQRKFSDLLRRSTFSQVTNWFCYWQFLEEAVHKWSGMSSVLWQTAFWS